MKTDGGKENSTISSSSYKNFTGENKMNRLALTHIEAERMNYWNSFQQNIGNYLKHH